MDPFGRHRGSDSDDENVQGRLHCQSMKTMVGFGKEIEQDVEGNIIFGQSDKIIIEKDRNENGQDHFQTRDEMKEMLLLDGHMNAKAMIFREHATVDQTSEIDRIYGCPHRIQNHMKDVVLFRIGDDMTECTHFG